MFTFKMHNVTQNQYFPDTMLIAISFSTKTALKPFFILQACICDQTLSHSVYMGIYEWN